MANYSVEKMTLINTMLTQTMPAYLASAEKTSEGYQQLRAELNMEIIQFCVGGQIKDTKNGDTIKFNKKLPSREQVATVAAALDAYIKKYEADIIEQDEDDDDDMSCNVCCMTNELAPVDKINNKQLKENILTGGTAGLAYYKRFLTGIDVITLAGIGEKARKDHNIKVAIIAGSVVLVAGAAVTAGVLIKKNHDNSCANPDLDELDVDVDDVDVDEIEDLDIPEVEVEDVPALD